MGMLIWLLPSEAYSGEQKRNQISITVPNFSSFQKSMNDSYMEHICMMQLLDADDTVKGLIS